MKVFIEMLNLPNACSRWGWGGSRFGLISAYSGPEIFIPTIIWQTSTDYLHGLACVMAGVKIDRTVDLQEQG